MPEADRSSIFVVSLVLLGILIVLFVLVSWVKRRMFQADAAESPAGFTLAELRSMLRAGQISQAEYDRARAKLIERVQKSAAEAEEDKQSAG